MIRRMEAGKSSSKENKKKHRGFKAAVFIASLLVVIIASTTAIILFIDNSQYVFEVSGIKIEKQEMLYYMNDRYSTVAADLETQYGMDSFEEGFWNKDYNGVKPLEVLKNNARDEIIRIRTEERMAIQNNIPAELSFPALQAKCKTDNLQRAKDAKAGKTLYGPVELDFSTYFTNQYLQMQTLLKKALNGKAISVADSEILEYYEEHKAELKNKEGAQLSYDEAKTSISQYLIDGKYEAYIKEQTAKAKVVIFDEYRKIRFQ